MHCYRKVTEDLYWVGANNRRLMCFEGIYSVPNGMAYNSYLLMDEKTVLFDTVDNSVQKRLFENIEDILCERKLDYLVVHHMEPDHSDSIEVLVNRYPNLKIICNDKISDMLKQFFTFDVDSHVILMKEGDSFCSGRHTLKFMMAPMVHWPEVMVSYDETDKVLFSADAFGLFGALNGALFADEVDFDRDYLDEARRYYTNIVGKYGAAVQLLLKKAAALDIKIICPLHGFVWRDNLSYFIDKYMRWSSYEAEEEGVMIAYASVYGNTENTAEILSSYLRCKGIKTVMFDVAIASASDLIAAAFKWSHLVLATTTYNMRLFSNMDAFLSDLTAHNVQNKTVALIENGTWSPNGNKLMHSKLESCKNMNILEQQITVKSSLKNEQLVELEMLADKIAETF